MVDEHRLNNNLNVPADRQTMLQLTGTFLLYS